MTSAKEGGQTGHRINWTQIIIAAIGIVPATLIAYWNLPEGETETEPETTEVIAETETTFTEYNTDTREPTPMSPVAIPKIEFTTVELAETFLDGRMNFDHIEDLDLKVGLASLDINEKTVEISLVEGDANIFSGKPYKLLKEGRAVSFKNNKYRMRVVLKKINEYRFKKNTAVIHIKAWPLSKLSFNE